MKRVVVGIFIILVAIFLASCSQYTCPTYSKYSPQTPVQHTIAVKNS